MVRFLLLPFSLLYRFITALRNKAYDLSILKSTLFNLPIICVGNITVGGTGKTPHVEYLIDLLGNKKRIAVLSRGYKRKTSGFFEANEGSEPDEVGDEPYQIFKKFTACIVAVDEDRVHGVNTLLNQHRDLQLILLDDAFQHRAIKPGLSILLIDYSRPIFKDFLLPGGNLRESSAGIKRADIVVVTKVPSAVLPDIREFWKRKLRLNNKQKLFFSGFSYGNLVKVFNLPDSMLIVEEVAAARIHVLLVTGIANARPLENFLSGKGVIFEHMRFSDHHQFSNNDLLKIEQRFNEIPSAQKIILTTEKDAVRLHSMMDIPENMKSLVYMIPIKVNILFNQQQNFNDSVQGFANNFSPSGNF